MILGVGEEESANVEVFSEKCESTQTSFESYVRGWILFGVVNLTGASSNQPMNHTKFKIVAARIMSVSCLTHPDTVRPSC